MPTYHVIGKTKQGEKVEKVIEANNRDEALFLLPKTVGTLRNNFEIIKLEQLDRLDDYPKKANRRLEPLMSDQEVIDFAKRIDEVTNDEWNRFRSFFSPMLKAAIRELWNDIVTVTPEEKEVELLNSIVKNIIPRYDPDRKMQLRTFIKLNVRSKLIKDWNRIMYINSNAGKKNLRRDAEIKSVLEQVSVPDKIDREELRLKIISVGKRIADNRVRLKKPVRIDFYSEIVSLGLHRECLKSQIQIETMELSYRNGFMKGEEVAKVRGVTPQSVNETRQSAERNILKYIQKKF